MLSCSCPASGEMFPLPTIKQKSDTPCWLDKMRPLSNSEPEFSGRLSLCCQGSGQGSCKRVRTGAGGGGDNGAEVEWRLALGSREVRWRAQCQMMSKDQNEVLTQSPSGSSVLVHA